MNRTYEDMSKEELVTLVKRLTKQHNEWRKKAFDLWAVMDNNAPHLLYIANEIYNPYPDEQHFKHEEETSLSAEVLRLRKREATFDEFIDSLDGQNEHEWMLIERIDEIHERLHGGEEE